MNLPYKKVAILGGGPSGLMVAYLLSKKQYDVTILEASDQMGGLAQSISLWGTEVEIGPHFLEYQGSPPVCELIEKLFNKDELILYKRDTALLLDTGQTFPYPPNIKSLIKGLSLLYLIKASISFFLAKFLTSKPKNSKDYIIGRMGSTLFNLFFKDYSEKLWGLPCTNLDLCYAQTMLPFNSSHHIIKNLFRRSKVQKPPQYIYFKNGISTLWNRLLNKCIDNGVSTKTNCLVEKCSYDNHKFSIILGDGQQQKYDAVISTLPTTINHAFFQKSLLYTYSYRNLVLVYIKTPKLQILHQQCLYLYRKDVKAIRITDFSRFPNPNKDFNILLMEYWVDAACPLWQATDDEILDIVKKDFHKIGTNVPIESLYTKRIPKAYRVPDLGIVEKINNDAIANMNIPFFAIGRNNSYQFNYGMGTAIDEASTFCDKW